MIYSIETDRCTVCPQSAPIAKNGRCHACPAGSFYTNSTKQCITCPAGAIFDQVSQTCLATKCVGGSVYD